MEYFTSTSAETVITGKKRKPENSFTLSGTIKHETEIFSAPIIFRIIGILLDDRESTYSIHKWVEHEFSCYFYIKLASQNY